MQKYPNKRGVCAKLIYIDVKGDEQKWCPFVTLDNASKGHIHNAEIAL